MKAMVTLNLIRDNPVTIEDINLAMQVYGPDIATIKGKSTRSRPIPAVKQHIEIPSTLMEIQKDVTLSIDGLEVNSLKFLTTISHDLCYRTAQYVVNATAKELEDKMDEIRTLYKKGGFTLEEIHCDNEFRRSMDHFAASPILITRVHRNTSRERNETTGQFKNV
jgi:hypothetical protein